MTHTKEEALITRLREEATYALHHETIALLLEAAQALASTPPAAQRPWLDLTDEQIKAIDEMALTKNMAIVITMATLKEVNT
jgi:hypothetical protein